jgi:flagellar basal-body rod protein FlgB
MSTSNIGLFQALGAKMGYLNTRQRVISENIANADTPDYKARDVSNVDFDFILRDITKPSTIRPEMTQSGHLPPAGFKPKPTAVKSDITYEVTPTGNSVSVEEQMTKASNTMIDYNLMTNIYQKNMNLIRMAISGSQG